MSDFLMNNYKPLPIAFTHGEGSWLFDENGTKYLDAVGGIAVCALGHNHPRITAAIRDQAKLLLHTSNMFHIPHQEHAAENLCRATGMEKIFFCNSGAEANETAIKLARLFGHQQKIDHPTIIVMENAFHGRTMATLTASGGRKYQAGFEPLVSGFLRVPYNDIGAINAIAEQTNNDVVAVLLEPVQGESGVVVPDIGYLQQVREICDSNNWLMIVDEVQTGMGRTGELFAFQAENIVPDIVTSAKALGSGIPVGACLASGIAATLFQPGSHGSTFGGNPLATRVADTTLQIIQQEGLPKRAKALGEQLLQHFNKELAELPHVKQIRGKGLMLGIELTENCNSLKQAGLEQKIIVNVARDYTLRLLPPLVLTDSEAEFLADNVVKIVKDFAA